jgi:hypothetical protein
MKFEQLLQIYWARGFLYGGRAEPYNITFKEFFENKPGINTHQINLFIKRFEFYILAKQNNNFLLFPLDYRKIINMYFSQLTSINSSLFELLRYNMIRLYLIKSHRGRCLVLGKPSRGQRTWSNAWTAYRNNSILKKFISDVKKFNKITKKVESLNRKFLKRKTKIKKPKIKMIFTKKRRNFWF